MHLYRKIILAAVCFATLLTACKKEEDTTKEYLTGTLSISMPGYLKPGDSKTFNVADLAVLSRTDGGNVGYYVSYAGQKVNDTLWTESGKHIKGITSSAIISSKHIRRNGLSKAPRSAIAYACHIRTYNLIGVCQKHSFIHIYFRFQCLLKSFISRI